MYVCMYVCICIYIYTYTLLLFVVTTKNLFENNSELYEQETRLCKHLHLPAVNLAKFDKGLYITGKRFLNQVPD
jgi:hypothetical protein